MFQSLRPQDVLPPIVLDYPEVLGVELFDRYGASFGICKDCLDFTGSQELLLTQKVKSSCVHFNERVKS